MEIYEPEAPSRVPPVIRRIDELVVKRMAARELAKRRSSAAKKLVGNSIDAGASSVSVAQMFQLSWFMRLALRICWLTIHILFSIYLFGSYLLQVVETYITSIGFLKRYQNLQLHKLKYLAVVMDSKEARNTPKVKELLLWLSNIGINYVMLYDMEGVLKNSLDGDLSSFTCGMTCIPRQDRMTIELLSFADSKGGVAKAAGFLCSKYLNDELTGCNKKEPEITESEVSDALNAVGCGGPDPDLLLVYGPVRSHLGFPAWRIRYTEIIHMGSLESMKNGAILKAFYDYSMKKQNYGS